MVAVILDQKNDTLRSRLEESIVDRLGSLGYQAVSSIHEFGVGKLSQLSEEGTYLTLCDNGIDAVMTVAAVEKSARPLLKNGSNKEYTNAFYYQRIWNYRGNQDKQPLAKKIPQEALNWECILFDLSALEPQCVLQADYTAIKQYRWAEELSRLIIQKMIREKIIVNTGKIPVKTKAF